jgi:DNA-binding FadR family transcriptional regulator
MNEALKRISAAEAVVNHFKAQIESGALKSGDKLPSERVLQSTLHISRFSLREGLARLSALGIIRIIHGKGAFVAKELNPTSLTSVFLPLFSANELQTYRDLCEARLVIECESATRSAKKHTSADIGKLRALLQQMHAAADDARMFGQLDHRFHRTIVAIARNVFFEQMFDVIDAHMKQFLLHHAQSASARSLALRQHRKIEAAIASGNCRAVGPIIEKHLIGCKRRFERTYNEISQKRKD